jgi:hypothetical protein
MRWVRVATGDEIAYGVVDGGSVRLGAGDPFAGWTENGATIPLERARLLAPVRPTKIVAVGLNYRDHAAEMRKALPEEPLLFSKPPSALLDPGGTILLPPESAEVHYEGELAVVIGRRCRRVRRDPRLHGDDRRDRTRPPAEGRAVHAREGLRHVRAARSLDRHRRRPARPRDRDPRRRRSPPALADARAHLPGRRAGRVRFPGDDARAGRRDLEIESVGVLRCRVAAERRS